MSEETKVEKTTAEKLAELSSRQARSVVAVIDALAQRGSFKGEELATIGQLREQSTQITQLAEMVLSAEAMKSAKSAK